MVRIPPLQRSTHTCHRYCQAAFPRWRATLSPMTQLLWDGQRVVVLRSVLDVSQDGALAGRAVVETPLIEVINTLKYKPLGKTDELALCVAATAGMQCLPTLHHPDAWHLGLYSDTGSLLPVANALAGKTGYVVTPDYRGRKVVAA